MLMSRSFGQNTELKIPILANVSIKPRMMSNITFPHKLKANNPILKLFMRLKVTLKVKCWFQGHFGQNTELKIPILGKVSIRPRMMCDTTLPHNLNARNPILKLYSWLKVIFKVKCWSQGNFNQNIDLKFPNLDKVSNRPRMMCDTTILHKESNS